MNCTRLFIVLWFAVVGVAGEQAARAADIPPTVRELEQKRIAAIAKAKRSAISVFARGGQGGGSGVVITPDGYALTNFHVSKPAGNHMRCSLPNGEIYDAVIVGIDPTGDVALIKLLGRDDFPAATMGDSDNVRVGDWCFAVGNPFLLATDLQPTVTYGIVSGVHRYQYPAGTLLEYADCIQTDASINPGNSGGPLFDAHGDLIGINGRGSFEKRGRVNVGVGYAISINQIKHFMGYLRSGRIVDHATLGASVTTNDDGRVVVSDILETSDAYRRGLRYGDEILAFGGRLIDSANSLKNVLGIFPKGWRVPLSYRRDGQRYDVLVRLAGVHGREELLAKIEGAPEPPAPPERPKGDQPDGDEPEKKPRELPKIFQHMRVKKMPEHVKKVFQARSGYANYHFNRLNRDRIWKSFLEHADLTGRDGQWQLAGQTKDGGAVVFSLDEPNATMTFPDGEAAVDLAKDLDTQLAPADSGGLLAAAAMWRRLLLLGPEKYGEVYYLGTAPLATGEPLSNLADVLVATYDVSEARFYFEPESGRLEVLEYFPQPEGDPSEIHFSDYRETDAGELPHRWEVRHGDRVFAVIKFESFTLPPSVDKDA